MTVLGLDSCANGWLAVAVDDAGFVDAFIAPTIAHAEGVGVDRWGVSTIVVDIPIGIPDSGSRLADVQARRFITPRNSSVFSTPVRSVLAATTYDEARARSMAATGGTSLSQQAWAIVPKIVDVDTWVRSGSGTATILEGHPEVSFRAMAQHPIGSYKKTLDGALLRRDLLHAQGIELPSSIPSDLRGAAMDDMHDAAAMAWSARRVEIGEAESMPATPETFSDGIPSAIWF